MATEVISYEKKTDDLEAKRGNGEVTATQTIPFSFRDSGPLEIDLSDPNASALAEVIEEYVNAARPAAKSRGGSKSSSPKSSSTPKSSSGGGSRPDNGPKRDFWQAVIKTHPDAVPGYSERGRIPTLVSDLFDKTGGDAEKVGQYLTADGGTSTIENTPASPTDVPQPDPYTSQAPAPVTDQGDEDQGEQLPQGWKRVDDGTGTGSTVVIDEDGFDKTDAEVAQALASA